MFSQAAGVTAGILFFRAGPQDMPYSAELTRVLLPAAMLANFWTFALALPPMMAAVMAISMILALALAVRLLLKARGMDARYNQTLNALLATGTVLTLALLIPFSQVAPALMQAAQDPNLLQHPETLNLPQGAVMLMNLMNFWNLGVNGHIFRQAMNINFALGLLVALMVAMSTLFAVGMVVGIAMA